MAERSTLGIPGVVLFLEIHGALGLRGGGFLLGCQLAAIFGLFAHPGGHLICQAGEHSAMCVNGLASESALPLFVSFTLLFDQTIFLACVLVGIERDRHRSPRGIGVTTDTTLSHPSSRQRDYELRKLHVHARNSHGASAAKSAPNGLARSTSELANDHRSHVVATLCDATRVAVFGV